MHDNFLHLKNEEIEMNKISAKKLKEEIEEKYIKEFIYRLKKLLRMDIIYAIENLNRQITFDTEDLLSSKRLKNLIKGSEVIPSYMQNEAVMLFLAYVESRYINVNFILSLLEDIVEAEIKIVGQALIVEFE